MIALVTGMAKAQFDVVNFPFKIPVVNSCEILSILSYTDASLSKPFIVWTVNFSNIQSFALSFAT